MPLKLYVMMLDGIKNNRISSNLPAFQFVMCSLTQPALKLRTSWDSNSAFTIDGTFSLTLSFIDPSGLECVVWCGHPLVPGCWLKNAFGNLPSVW